MIREAYFTDTDRIMHIWLTASERAHDFITKDYWKEKYAEVKDEYIPKARTFVYVEKGIILGFVSVVDDKYLGAIFVDINHQKKGIGRKLTDFVKKKYKSLSLCVYEKNIDAVEFYKKNDFDICRSQVDKNTGETELIMTWSRNKAAA